MLCTADRDKLNISHLPVILSVTWEVISIMSARARARTHTHTHTHAHARTHARIHTSKHARTHARTHMHRHTHARTHAYSIMHAHARTHAHTHARAHTHTHTHTHTRTPRNPTPHTPTQYSLHRKNRTWDPWHCTKASWGRRCSAGSWEQPRAAQAGCRRPFPPHRPTSSCRNDWSDSSPRSLGPGRTPLRSKTRSCQEKRSL